MAAYGDLATVVVSDNGREHVVLSDGYRRVRFDIVQGTLLAGPARLDYRLSGFVDVDARILTLRRLVALSRLGRFAGVLHARERSAPRWIMALRTYDAMSCSASQRDVCRVLFGAAGASDWRQGSEFLRLRVQRLVRTGRFLIGGGYRTLLR